MVKTFVLFETGSGKWIELTTNEHNEPCAKWRSTKSYATPIEIVSKEDPAFGHLLDR